jgi:hypothetical protein
MFGGPGNLRFFVQPAIALLLGLRDGRNDARAGRPPYFLTVLRSAGRRLDRLREGLRAIVVPLSVAFALDLVLQYVIREQLRLWAAFVYVLIFVTLPYVLARGLANRGLRRHRGEASRLALRHEHP